MDRVTEKVIRCILNIEGYVSTDTLAELTKISASNIKHNLPQMKKELAEYGVKLQSVPKKGVCVIASGEQKQKVLEAIREEVSRNSEFYAHRKEYILETLYMFKANYTIQLFADELSVSKNTIIRDLEQINKELTAYNIRIKKVRNQGVVLEGYEFNIRQSMTETYNLKYWNWSSGIIVESTGEADPRISKRAYTYLSNMYSIKEIAAVEMRLWNAEKKIGVQFTDISFCRLLEYIVIMKQRIHMEKWIRKDYTSNYKKPIDTAYYEAAAEIVHSLIPNHKKSSLEIKYLAARLFVASACSYVSTGLSDYREVVMDFLWDIEEIIETKILSVNEDLIETLGHFLHQVEVREVFQILDWDDLHCDVRERCTNIYAICMANSYKLQQKLHIPFHEDDIAWITLLIDNCLKDKENKIPTVFVHGTNESRAVFQKRIIEKRIPEVYISRTVYFKEFQEQGNSLVISTVPFKMRKKNVVEITKHVNEKDLDMIRKKIQKIDWKEKRLIRQQVLAEVFEEAIIHMELNASTKEEVIGKMADMLKTAGYVEEGYARLVLETESKCSSAIGNAVAIPHYYQDHIKENKIAIAKLRYPVDWDTTEKVTLVFLIAIRYEEREKVKQLFRYLYQLVNNKETLKKIKMSATKQELLGLLRAFEE